MIVIKKYILIVSVLLLVFSFITTVTNASELSSRQVWIQATKGQNLSFGRAVTFSQKPNYAKTADKNDPYDLTDGKLCPTDKGIMPYNRESVGWRLGGMAQNVNLLIDLGTIQPVGTVVGRFFGNLGAFHFPRRITIVGSNDGKTFFRLASIQQVAKGQQSLANHQPDQYFYPTSTTKTLVFPVHRRVRYVGMHIEGGSSFIFTDGLAVMKEEKPNQAAGLNGLTPVRFFIHGVTIQPRHNRIVITTNVPTPVRFNIIDARPASKQKQPVHFIFDLPSGVTVLKTLNGKAHRDQSAPAGINRWILKDFYNPKKNHVASVFFAIKKGTTLAPNATATLISKIHGKPDNATTIPIRTIQIPAVGNTQDLNVSLAWMYLKQQKAYPHFFTSFNKMGFNTIGLFPRRQKTLEEKKKMIEYVKQARKRGFRILYNESAFHVMTWRHHTPEIYNQINGKKGKYPCICYTGQYYHQELQRIATAAEQIHPDEIFFDIELWHKPAIAEAEKCSRCQAAFKKSGFTDWKQFVIAQGTRMMRDLHNAVAGSAPEGKDPLVGSYNVYPLSPSLSYLYNFKYIYPRYLQIAQPSLYVAGNVQQVHDRIRAIEDQLKSRRIIPWLTTGTYGEFPPRHVAQMVLESYLNGARGIAYYSYRDFDPMDFYYNAKALELLVPYKKLLRKGMKIAVSGNNNLLTYSAWGTEKHALILIGNYSHTSNTKTKLTVSNKHIAYVYDVKNNKKLDLQVLQSLEVQPGKQRLLLVGFDK